MPKQCLDELQARPPIFNVTAPGLPIIPERDRFPQKSLLASLNKPLLLPNLGRQKIA